MSRAIPLGPLVFALAGIGLMGVSAYLMLTGKLERSRTELSAAETSSPEEEGTLLTYHDPVRARGFVDIMLGQSPFVADRSAYSRNTPSVPEPVEPELNPEFVGTIGRGDEISAFVIWEPGQAAQKHMIGDETPWGVLVLTTSSTLVFEGENGRRELELF
ncbi:MAG: hypothetical protein K0U61_09625 [Alphaproteobacteria bacterium]|nr:hypothetical protein [Alphaproteobacteria bacterium]